VHTVTGTKNAASTGTRVDIDAFVALIWGGHGPTEGPGSRRAPVVRLAAPSRL
jgi:hypothetical protein